MNLKYQPYNEINFKKYQSKILIQMFFDIKNSLKRKKNNFEFYFKNKFCIIKPSSNEDININFMNFIIDTILSIYSNFEGFIIIDSSLHMQKISIEHKLYIQGKDFILNWTYDENEIVIDAPPENILTTFIWNIDEQNLVNFVPIIVESNKYFPKNTIYTIWDSYCTTSFKIPILKRMKPYIDGTDSDNILSINQVISDKKNTLNKNLEQFIDFDTSLYNDDFYTIINLYKIDNLHYYDKDIANSTRIRTIPKKILLNTEILSFKSIVSFFNKFLNVEEEFNFKLKVEQDKPHFYDYDFFYKSFSCLIQVSNKYNFINFKITPVNHESEIFEEHLDIRKFFKCFKIEDNLERKCVDIFLDKMLYAEIIYGNYFVEIESKTDLNVIFENKEDDFVSYDKYERKWTNVWSNVYSYFSMIISNNRYKAYFLKKFTFDNLFYKSNFSNEYDPFFLNDLRIKCNKKLTIQLNGVFPFILSNDISHNHEIIDKQRYDSNVIAYNKHEYDSHNKHIHLIEKNAKDNRDFELYQNLCQLHDMHQTKNWIVKFVYGWTHSYCNIHKTSFVLYFSKIFFSIITLFFVYAMVAWLLMKYMPLGQMAYNFDRYLEIASKTILHGLLISSKPIIELSIDVQPSLSKSDYIFYYFNYAAGYILQAFMAIHFALIFITFKRFYSRNDVK